MSLKMSKTLIFFSLGMTISCQPKKSNSKNHPEKNNNSNEPKIESTQIANTNGDVEPLKSTLVKNDCGNVVWNKSKVAVPFPRSHAEALVVLAVGAEKTVS